MYLVFDVVYSFTLYAKRQKILNTPLHAVVTYQTFHVFLPYKIIKSNLTVVVHSLKYHNTGPYYVGVIAVSIFYSVMNTDDAITL